MTKILLDAGPSERGWHRIEEAARCLRLFAWHSSGKLSSQLQLSEPLIKGSLLHIGLAHYYIRKQAEAEGQDPDRYLDPEEAVRTLAVRSHAERPNSLWDASVPVIIMALRAYENRWHDCSWKVVDVEEELRAHIPSLSDKDPFLFTQRGDLTVQDPHGFYWIVDHKSCYRIQSNTLRQHILSGQFLGYQIFGRQKYGKKFGGVIVNRVKLSEPYQFDRTVLEPAPHALKRFAKNLALTEHMVDMFEDKPPEEWPAAYSDQVCWGKYGKCSAFDLCQWGEP